MNDYISQPAEAAVNALQIGRELGISPGTAFPGKEAALKIFEDAANKNGVALD